MAMTTAKFDTINLEDYTTGYDYRWGGYDEDDYKPHPHDNSLVSFRGHKVTRTLIRCHFSPPNSTNSRYVYTGSSDGNIHIYNMDATLAGKIKVDKAAMKPATPYGRGQRFDFDEDEDGDENWNTLCRDVSWHPNAPVIAGMYKIPFMGFYKYAHTNRCSIVLEWVWTRRRCSHCTLMERWCR
jgi:WD repeat-containing protein 23